MRVKLIHTTAFRLAMRYAVFVSLLTVTCFAIIYWITVAQLHSQIDAGLRAEVAALTRLYDLKGVSGLRQTVAALSTTKSLMASNAGDAGPRQYLLADSRFRPMVGSLMHWPKRMRGHGMHWETVNVSQLHTEPDLDNDRYRFRMRAVTIELPDGDHLLVGQSLSEIIELRESMFALMLAAVALVLGAGLLGGAVVGRGVVRRLQAVTQTADTIMSGDLSQRIPQQRQRDEFGALASKLNAMLERIETLMKSTREVTENVAHDLRSPLTRLRARAEMALMRNASPEAREEALRRGVEEIDGIVATLNAILGIARIESGVNREWSDVDLTAVCRDADELYEPLAEERRIRFVSRIAEGVHVRGNAQLVAQAVGNLLDNAIKYAPAAGHVSLTLERSGSGASITVADNGAGIPVEMREKAFERFVRLDSSRSLAGNGLGLSLVKAVADLHEARIVMEDNQPGLRIRLIFENRA
ncbi:MAG TPA: HAMP domain-containing sensor histidine kinase [Gammaproteobacteria bacterium]|nr:HAMP domain-containing sensor histidine kinase [Gammaproteobacteria bacterium]